MRAGANDGPLFVLDFDGLIVDTHDLWLAMLRRVSLEMGDRRPIPDDVWDQLDDVSFPAMLRHLGVPRGQMLLWARRVVEEMADPAYQPRVFEGMGAAIRELAEAGPVAILSASPGALIRRTLAHAGLEEAIDLVAGGPDPRGKAERLPGVIGRFRARRARTVIVGDAVSDVRAGQQCRIRTAAVTWGWQSRARLEAAGPDFLLSRVEELCTLPDRLR